MNRRSIIPIAVGVAAIAFALTIVWTDPSLAAVYVFIAALAIGTAKV